MSLTIMYKNSVVESSYFYSFTYFEYLWEDHDIVQVVLYDRVSSAEYRAREAEARRMVLQQILERKKFDIIAYYCDIADGFFDEVDKRTELRKAVEMAEELGVLIVAPSVDRVIRSCKCREKNMYCPLVANDMAYMDHVQGDAVIATVIPPDTQPSDICEIFSAWNKMGKVMLSNIR